jgi:hypothetical protein
MAGIIHSRGLIEAAQVTETEVGPARMPLSPHEF